MSDNWVPLALNTCSVSKQGRARTARVLLAQRCLLE